MKFLKAIDMKKTCCTFCILFLFCFTSFGQTKWGVNAGMGLNRIFGYGGLGIKTGMLFTAQGSVFASVTMGKKKNLVFMPSLGYLPKGVKFDKVTFTDNSGNVIGEGNQKLRIDYLQLSLPIGLKMDWGKNADGFIGTGPYMAYALSARQKNYTNPVNGNSIATTEKLDFNKAMLNRFDAGFTVHVNITFSKHWIAGLSSDIGITKLNSAGTITTRNQATHVFAGYVF